MKKRENSGLILINRIYLLVLIAVVFPLLYIGRYCFPMADDWSYGKEGYQAWIESKNVLMVIKAAFLSMKNAYHTWDGRFGSNILIALQPGIFSEQCYRIVPWIMIGSIVLSECYLCGTFLKKGREEDRILPLMTPFLLIQLLYVPYIDETFYWYTGGVSYTFFNSLFVFLTALVFRIAGAGTRKSRSVLRIVLCLLTAILVGGSNFATSVCCFLALLCITVFYFITDRVKFKRVWFCPLLVGASILACVLAPGNAHRMDGNFADAAGHGIAETIFLCLYRTLTNIYSWTNAVMILTVLLTLPFMVRAVGKMDFSFRLPGLFTFLSFGIYASMLSATIYVDGTNGGRRMGDILWYNYVLWLAVNAFYWTGWAQKRMPQRWKEPVKKFADRFLLLYCAVVGSVLAVWILIFSLKQTSFYGACRDLYKGYAAQYAKEWEERIEVLRDETIKDVVFEPLSVRPVTITYADLQEADGYLWVNEACAAYYGKNSVTVVPAVSE